MLHKFIGRGPLLAVVAASVALSACANIPGFRGRGEKETQIVYEERPVEALYNEGARQLDRGRYEEAIAYFREVERQHPYSEWSRRSIMMTAFAHYQQNNYEDAIAAADRFITLYPGHSNTPYAYYLRAQSWFEQILDVGRDQAATEQALAAMREIVRRYPNTSYAADARLKIDMVNDQLAGKEMAVGRWYLRNNQPLAAAGRFKNVIDKYQTTSHTAEALYRLVEAYLTLGIAEEATRNGAVLGANYPGSPWYGDAYALLTDRGLRPAVTPQGERRGFFRRLRPG